ncbi:hypothetical protein B0H14DRAFT_2583335 [Mycena olivaceomarginata]|nr:hypothetical protein B0H14DRAFT_2583335 [Mycena olivaceomarginata]
MPAFSIDSLLNAEAPEDASHELRLFRDFVSRLDLESGQPILVAPDVRRYIMLLTSSWTSQPPNIAPPPPPPPPIHPPPPPPPSSGRTVERNVQLTTRTALSVLYRYAPGTSVEYPESGIDDPVGHLIPIGLDNWVLPWRDFTYSRGAPDGGSSPQDLSYIPLLVDADGRQVACRRRHVTCFGMKACPFADIDKLTSQYNHTSATLADVQNRLAEDRNQRLVFSSPTYHPTSTPSAVLVADVPSKKRLTDPRKNRNLFAQQKSDAQRYQRGYQPPSDSCDGRIIFHEANSEDEKQFKAYLSCEHYSRQSRNHWADFTVADGEYDLEYIAAVFTDDTEEIFRIEMAAERHKHGPLAFCGTLTNHSTQRVFCPLDHREDDQLVRKELCHLECHVKFQIWYPVEEERVNCPYALVTSVASIYIQSPFRRRLLMASIKAFLYSRFPDIQNPTLSHLHRNHLSAYISQVKKDHFPHGTDWKGVAHLKRLQDEHLPKEEHYIRVMLELDDNTLPVHEEDDPPVIGETTTRIIICMTPDASHRLKTAGYLQRDIGFRRIVGFHEFEIASMDRDAIPASYSAGFEQQLHGYGFSTGEATNIVARPKVSVSILLVSQLLSLLIRWTSMSLVALCAALGPMEHLCRVFRLCKVHNYRNIEACAVSSGIKTMMRSLACIRHPRWDETIAKIIEHGGKPALDWVRDKESSQFAFAGICWERSFIPHC